MNKQPLLDWSIYSLFRHPCTVYMIGKKQHQPAAGNTENNKHRGKHKYKLLPYRY